MGNCKKCQIKMDSESQESQIRRLLHTNSNPWRKGDRVWHHGRAGTVTETRGYSWTAVHLDDMPDREYRAFYRPDDLELIRPSKDRELLAGQWVFDGHDVGVVTGYGFDTTQVSRDDSVVDIPTVRLTKIPAPPMEVGDWVTLDPKQGKSDPYESSRVCRMVFDSTMTQWSWLDHLNHMRPCSDHRVVAHDKP
jgi:hypothetical protein